VLWVYINNTAEQQEKANNQINQLESKLEILERKLENVEKIEELQYFNEQQATAAELFVRPPMLICSIIRKISCNMQQFVLYYLQILNTGGFYHDNRS
jgi:hypothetical protein